MDSQKSGACVCLFIGVISVLVGLILAFGVLDGQMAPDDAALLHVFGWVSICEGSVYFGLAWGISTGVPICAIIAACLYSATSLLMVLIGEAGAGCGGPVLRVVCLGLLWKSAYDLWPGRQARREREAEEVRMERFDRISPRGREDGAPLIRRTDRYQKKSDDDLAHMRCPNCQKVYPMDAKTCVDCNVGLFEW